MKTKLTTLVMTVCVMVMLTGCAIGLGGGRATFTMPFGDPITVEGSTAVAAKHGTSNGAILPQNADGTAAKAGETLSGTADQIVQAGGDIRTDKATDVGATGGVGNQATKAAGVVGGGAQGAGQRCRRQHGHAKQSDHRTYDRPGGGVRQRHERGRKGGTTGRDHQRDPQPATRARNAIG